MRAHGLGEVGDVARVGHEDVDRAQQDGREAVRLKREYMIERQRRHEDFLPRTQRGREPGIHLLQIGDDVAMGEHRALRHACRSAGILQEGDFARADA